GFLPRTGARRQHGRGGSKGQEVPPSHSITSSARASRDGGTVRPSASAVRMFKQSSIVIGCWNGKSEGRVPAITFASIAAACRNSEERRDPYPASPPSAQCSGNW